MNFDSFGFGDFGFFAVAIGIFSLLIFFLPAWRIVAKTGNPGVLSLGLLLPVANIILIFYLAFSEWPIERELKRARGHVS